MTKSIYDNGCPHNWVFETVLPDSFAEWRCERCGVTRAQNLRFMMNDLCNAQEIAQKYEDRYFHASKEVERLKKALEEVIHAGCGDEVFYQGDIHSVRQSSIAREALSCVGGTKKP